MQTSVIVPALNEEASIGQVLSAIPGEQVHEIIVVDGGSSDGTAGIAESAGARVVQEPRRGYGQACSTGSQQAQGDILVFLDADGADDPREIQALIDPLKRGTADMVLGSRLAGEIHSRAMPWQQYFGNWLSAGLIRVLYRERITDLSPFRAVYKHKLESLEMSEMTYGWPTEMIVKALRQGWRVREVAVNYRPRLGGASKISGTLRGTILSTYFILRTVFRYAFVRLPHQE